MPTVSSELQNSILARQREGATITQIAQELGLSRTTVYKSLTAVDNWEAWVKDKSNNIRRLAYNAVEKGLSKGDARLGMDWLKATDLAPQTGDRYSVHGDMTVQQHLTLLPQPSTPVTTSTAGTTSTDADRSSQKGAASDMSLSNHTNFSQFSLAELEAEVARRKAQVVDVEVFG